MANLTMPKAQGYIGLDFGTTNSALCYTTLNTVTGQFNEPEPIRFGHLQFVRSLLLLDASETRVEWLGERVYEQPAYLHHPERVWEQFKLQLGENPTAPRVVELFCRALLDQFKHALNLSGTLSERDWKTALGVPAQWLIKEPDKVELVTRAAAAAGFPAVEPIAEPIGAMLYHAYRGDLGYHERAERWIVVDIGGGTTDLVLLETEPGGARPRILKTFGETYGGRNFDELLLQKFLADPNVWQGDAPTAKERLELLRFVRNFKEEFSNRLARGRTEYSFLQLFGKQRVQFKLTRQQFESEAVAETLMDRFSSILLDVFQDSPYALNDVNQVILTGGSARWYFVRERAERTFGRTRVILSSEPELTIARGLALALTDFSPHAAMAQPEESLPTQNQAQPQAMVVSDGTRAPQVVAQYDENSVLDKFEQLLLKSRAKRARELDLAVCRKRAQSNVNRYTLAGGGVGLIASPIPGLGQLPLTAMETKLVANISRIYGYRLSEKDLIAIVGGLLVVGTAIKIGAETLSLIPGPGWVLKGAIAGGVIKALGEGVIRFFDAARRRELARGSE